MDETSYMDAADEVMMPGFRFHPTDEELVDFYLKMKIQKKPLAIELIRQLDIYKYDPWDLPMLAPTGETEWYFYCPRGRKYRNSTRPNRVTVAGFWKATGADRPIYSSKETKCIGLKKSLVFYRGKAAKGVKTEWMMHEFRLPSPIDSSLLKKPFDKHTSTDESWTICRIFKKISSPKEKAQLESWVPPKPKTNNSNIFSISTVNTRFGSGKLSCITEGRYEIQFGCNNSVQQQPNYLTNQRPSVLHDSDAESQNNMVFSSVDPSKTPPLLVDVAPIILKIPPKRLASDRTLASKDFRHTQQSNFLKVDTQLGIKWNFGSGQEGSWIRGPLNTCNLSNELGEKMRMMSSPINLLTDLPNEWKPYFTGHSEMSTGYSSSKCHN